MNTPFNGLPQGADRIVYVREVAVEDLPDDVQAQMDGRSVIWSVHGADGRQLAQLTSGRLHCSVDLGCGVLGLGRIECSSGVGQ